MTVDLCSTGVNYVPRVGYSPGVAELCYSPAAFKARPKADPTAGWALYCGRCAAFLPSSLLNIERLEVA